MAAALTLVSGVSAEPYGFLTDTFEWFMISLDADVQLAMNVLVKSPKNLPAQTQRSWVAHTKNSKDGCCLHATQHEV